MTSRVNTDPRISRRRRAIARSKRKKMFTAAAVVSGLAFAVWLTFWSPLLVVRNIRLVGAKHVTPDEIARVAHISSGRNLLLLSTSEVARSVETLPWVAAAEVDRILPGTVRVKVAERRPSLELSLGAARWLIDAHGEVLASAGAHARLPILGGVQPGNVHPGARLSSPEVVAALTTWRHLPERIRSKLKAIIAPSATRITLSLTDGTVVRWGSASNAHDKAVVLTALLDRVHREHLDVAYIDVRVPEDPAVAPVASAAPSPVTTGSVAPSPAATPSPHPSPSR
ncbi:MAG: FtsQ-type POTRA domain-containing protein [Actinomycetota bacterium]|nr:FtsQ-type POTRA domain-containing protein [Actinomycetota bacterium]